MNAFRVYVSDAANKDMHETVTYIAKELLEPYIANRLLDTLHDAISSLSEIPHRHKLVDRAEVFDRPVRVFTVENYLVFKSLVKPRIALTS
jgi:toxin ParE1/3/4